MFFHITFVLAVELGQFDRFFVFFWSKNGKKHHKNGKKRRKLTFFEKKLCYNLHTKKIMP